MKKAIPYIIIAILLIIILCQNCTGSQTKKVDVPEVKGSFKAIVPKTETIKIPVKYTVKDTAEINRLKRLYNFSQEEIFKISLHNQTIVNSLGYVNDSITNAILQSSKYQEFRNDFENDTIRATVTGISKGPVERLAIPQFIIKKRTLDIPEKKLLFRVILGAEAGINKELNQGTYKADLFVQDKNNNLWSGSFQKMGSQQYYLLGFHKSIFSIKK